MQALILASASPRRHELLGRLGVHFVVDAADIDESVRPGEAARDYVVRMAREKAEAVSSRRGDGGPVLAADTTVVVDGDILGKPADHFAGLAMLARLGGRTHSVITAVCLQTEHCVAALEVETLVTFLTLNREVCEQYLATPEPWDKAGGYAIQGLGGALVSGIEGSYSNVVGLPLAETWQLLARHGIATALGPADG
ncbi:Maf family protein [Haliea sp. E1-2-M8]|uniref:Maf family protein n=1 Tax=Haliea sp. E1-2-M8 TaxID=3064706 RepID=UPI002721E24A|nr:Maf family protein [Haliea sp. E1-2-M8]MDO8861351.1 Maf family protein [Haliea sp. E1-2-M8]